MATKKHDLGVVTDLFQNGGQIRREFKLGRFLAVIKKTYPNRTLVYCWFAQKYNVKQVKPPQKPTIHEYQLWTQLFGIFANINLMDFCKTTFCLHKTGLLT